MIGIARGRGVVRQAAAGRWLCALALLLAAGACADQGVEPGAELALPDLDGKVHRLADYRGKWVLVNYWATWCPPCLEELPELEVFHSTHADRNAVVLGVNMEDIDAERLRAFVAEQFLSYPILLAGARPVSLLGEVPGLPTSFLVNPQGEVVAQQAGAVTAQAISDFIERYEQRDAAGGTGQ